MQQPLRQRQGYVTNRLVIAQINIWSSSPTIVDRNEIPISQMEMDLLLFMWNLSCLRMISKSSFISYKKNRRVTNIVKCGISNIAERGERGST
jgi:hypothetical protein